MMIVDKILELARERGYTAVYGSAEQVNEMLTDVDFAASKDGTAVVMHLVTDSATVDGKDTAVVAVYFASLCDFDFDGESLLSEQERLKNIGKELLNSIRTGNEMTYADPRWQYGYDDYAENVAWVCLRVTLTASAADCVPMSPEPPAPPAPVQVYDIFCPQFIMMVPFYSDLAEVQNPIYYNGRYYATIAVREGYNTWDCLLWVGDQRPGLFETALNNTVTEENIAAWKQRFQDMGKQMTAETEEWLRERIGRQIWSIELQSLPSGLDNILAAYSATNYESKPVTAI